MRVRPSRSTRHRLSRSLCLVAVALTGALALTGCGNAKPRAVTVQNCGTSHTAAHVPVEIEVSRGQVSCSVALTVESSYASAIEAGQAPGNGGGGPVTVNGWKCQGFPTPELLKTGDASKCAKDGMEILAVLKAPS